MTLKLDISDAELTALDYGIPKDGTYIPTRAELGALIQDILTDAGAEFFAQPFAERLAQYMDAIYDALPVRLAEGAPPVLGNADTVEARIRALPSYDCHTVPAVSYGEEQEYEAEMVPNAPHVGDYLKRADVLNALAASREEETGTNG